MKTKTLHRHLHPIHWHFSMYVAIAAILVTSLKCSGEMLRALHAVPTHEADTMGSLHLRDAETRHELVSVNTLRLATSGGK